MGIQSLTREEILELLAEAKRHSDRDWMMILIAFAHGLRASEVTQLTPKHLSGGFLTVQRLKGSMKTSQPLQWNENPLLNELNIVDFASMLGSSERLFPICRQTFWRAIQRHAKAIELPPQKRNTKMLKHSIAMQTIKLAGIENVRQFLGHKSLSSTGAYLKVTDDEAARAVASALAD